MDVLNHLEKVVWLWIIKKLLLCIHAGKVEGLTVTVHVLLHIFFSSCELLHVHFSELGVAIKRSNHIVQIGLMISDIILAF